jgi:chromosome segregation ATPase
MDQINKLQDSVDEAQERLDDALWRLDKTKYFERLVARRKSLIVSLIESLRARNKAMVALKAGLDSLRSHKALAEETQQKLLARMEALKNELGAARDTIQEYQSSTMTKKELENSKSQISGLQERLKTQAELIQSLEEDLKTARVFKRDAEEKHGEVAQLHEELETKSTIISRLQADIDDQQRKLAKLRGSDSETMRLRAVKEQDRSKIEILERENAELRAMLESLEQSKPSGTEPSNEREQELQAKIRELTEAVSTWKRKYEFLSTEAPAAYQTHTAAKK